MVTMGNDASATMTTATTGTIGTAGDYAATTGRFPCLHSAIVVNVRAIIAAVTIFVDANVRWPTLRPTIGTAGRNAFFPKNKKSVPKISQK